MPLPSVTVQVTVVLPRGNVAGASLAAVAHVQLSVITAVPRFTPVALHDPASVFTLTVAGQVIVGSSSSVIVTV